MSVQLFSRRSFLVRAVIGIIAFLSAAIAAPLAGFGVLPVLKKKQADWSDAGVASDLAANEPHERRFLMSVRNGWQEEKVERTVWLVKKPDGGVTAFSANCPHLGCGYRWFPEEQRFKCPCHASVFDITGKVLSGPAPRPLDTLDTRIENNRVLVKFEAFQVGTPAKKEA